jgi:hypothetical protein
MWRGELLLQPPDGRLLAEPLPGFSSENADFTGFFCIPQRSSFSLPVVNASLVLGICAYSRLTKPSLQNPILRMSVLVHRFLLSSISSLVLSSQPVPSFFLKKK